MLAKAVFRCAITFAYRSCMKRQNSQCFVQASSTSLWSRMLAQRKRRLRSLFRNHSRDFDLGSLRKNDCLAHHPMIARGSSREIGDGVRRLERLPSARC